MGLVVEKQNDIRTVAALIDALRAYPADMPLGDYKVAAYRTFRIQPQPHERPDDPRGCVCVERQ